MNPSKMDFAKKLLALQQTLFLRSCSLCREALHPRQQTLCTGCLDSLPFNTQSCLRGAEYLVSSSICPACQKKPPRFRRCYTLYQYRYPISSAINRIKIKPFAPEAKQLSWLFADRLLSNYQLDDVPKLLIPMPIHPLKLLYRGFNQSLIIAQFLSSKMAGTGVIDNICRRKKIGRPQRLGSRRQRLKIPPDIFNLSHHSPLQGMSIALIDDVITTGATANAASASLLNASAKSVNLWCIAKTSWHNGSGSIKI